MDIESLKRAGGREWVAGDKHRIYFNNLEDLFDSHFKSLSRTRIREIKGSLSWGKLWYDLTTSEWGHRIPECRTYNGDQMAWAIIAEIERRVAAESAPESASVTA